MVSLSGPNMMKTPLLLVAVTCCLPVVSHVARASGQAVNVYVSQVSVSYPDPAGVDDMSSRNKDAVEVTLGFLPPKGCQFIKVSKKSQLDVTDALGVKKKAEFDSFFSNIPDSGAFAKCPLRLKEKLAFPIKLEGTVKMKVSEGTKIFTSPEFDVRKGTVFKVEGMDVTVKDVAGQGKDSGKLELEFKNTLNVKDITLTDGEGGKLEAWRVSYGSSSFFGSAPTCTYRYEVKKMPARMKAGVVVNKAPKIIDIPVKMTVDLNAPAK